MKMCKGHDNMYKAEELTEEEISKTYISDDEHVDKGVHGLGLSRGGQHTTPCAEGVGRTFEADAIQALIKGDGAFLHETTDDVVGDGVHDQLPPHHGGALAAHHDKAVIYSELAPPAPIWLAKVSCANTVVPSAASTRRP